METPLLPDRFRPIELIGSGGMAEVWLAQDTTLGENCALKIIHPHLARNSDVMERFRLELAVSRRIRHPNVLEIREFFEPSPGSGGPVFLSMEYLPGGDLKRRILRGGPLPWQEAVGIAKACLSALSAAHCAGIVHRDLKPQNILFAGDRSPRIADFGLARVGAEAVVAEGQSLAGTPDYCAPEMIRGDRADQRADIYSMGATLFEALAGRPPFLADSPYALFHAKASSRAPSLADLRPDLPAWLCSAVAASLETEPDGRFQTAEAFLEALKAEGGRSFSIAATDSSPSIPELCPRCGRSVPRSLGFCLDCGIPMPIMRPATGGKSAHRVVVLGTGKPGDKLSSSQRDLCLRAVEKEGVDVSQLRKSIPRTPFVLAAGLSGSSAEAIASTLGNEGLEAVADGPGRPPEERKKTAKALRKKMLTLLPRLYLILLGTGAINIASYGNLIRNAPGLLVIVLLLLATLPPVIMEYRGRRSYARVSADRLKAGDPALLAAAKAGVPESIKGIVLSIARKADSMEDAVARAEGLPSEDRSAMASSLEDALAGISGTIAAAAEAELLVADSGDAAGSGRERERRTDELKFSLLSCSAALDSATIGLARAEASRALSDIRLLEERARDAQDLAAGLRELEGDAP